MAAQPPGEPFSSRQFRRTEMYVCIAIILLAAVAILLQFRIDTERTKHATAGLQIPSEDGNEVLHLQHLRFSLYLPKAEFLRHASLGYRNVVADAVWLKAAYYVSVQFEQRAGQYGGRLKWLDNMYNVVVDLDPKWENAYWTGAMILAAVAEEPKEAIALLQKGRGEIPGSFKLTYELGLTYLFWRGHEAKAIPYFKEIEHHPECPPLLVSAIPRMLEESGRLEQAIVASRDRVERFGPDSTLGKAARRDLKEYTSRYFVQVLEDNIERFRKATDRFPKDLAELSAAHRAAAVARFRAASGRLPKDESELEADGYTPLPAADGYGKGFSYDAATGAVASEGLKIHTLNRQIGIMDQAVRVAEDNLGRKPKDIDEFVAALRAQYAGDMAADKLPSQIEDVMGRTLTMPEHPFGEEWRYDGETGTFFLGEDRGLDQIWSADER